MEQYIIIIIVGIIAVGGSLIGGFRIAQNRQQNKRVSTLMGIIVLVLAVAAWIYLQKTPQSTQSGVDSTPPQATVSFSRIEELTLGQTTSYQLKGGEILGLTYSAELGQVFTMHITANRGPSPQIGVITTVDGNPTTYNGISKTIQNVTDLCGYEIVGNGVNTFFFQAAATSSYEVQFEEGDTCTSK